MQLSTCPGSVALLVPLLGYRLRRGVLPLSLRSGVGFFVYIIFMGCCDSLVERAKAEINNKI